MYKMLFEDQRLPRMKGNNREEDMDLYSLEA